MTDREKVIKELSERIESANPWDTPPISCSVRFGLLVDALALLKEQKIAMKPKNIDKVGGNCPVCGLRMARSDKYCYQCGQEMDWE